MKMHKVSLMAALAAGALIALSPVLRAQDAKPEGRPPGQGQRGEMMKERLAKMAEELKLTDAQKPKVEAVLKEQGEKMRELRDATPEERREKGKALREETAKKLKDILTPEQYEKFLTLREQGPRGGGPGAGPAKKKDGANK
jgi:Spy/CpxP family protein refolding chaperone